jgi:hypothetical protein
MTIPRHGRRDDTESAIVDALEAIGIVVRRLSHDGLPDLLTYSRGVWRPIEVKRRGGHLTDAQVRLYRLAPFPIVDSLTQALALFGVVDV